MHFKFRAKLFGVSCDWGVVRTCKAVRKTNENRSPCTLDRNRALDKKDWSIILSTTTLKQKKKVLFSSFPKNGHTTWFDPQSKKIEPHFITKQTAQHESTVQKLLKGWSHCVGLNYSKYRDETILRETRCAITGKRAAHNRAQIVYHLAENLELRHGEFSQRISDTTGCTLDEARREVDATIQRLFYWGAYADKYGGTVQVGNTQQRGKLIPRHLFRGCKTRLYHSSR